MIHIIYILVIVLVFLFAFGLGRAYEKDKSKKLLKEKDDKYNTFLKEFMLMAESMDAECVEFTSIVKEKDDLILKLEQRNLYLEHIVKEMVLEQE